MLKQRILPILVFGVLSISACSKALIIDDVNYAQYVESVLTPNENGFIEDYRNNVSFSVEPIVMNEFNDTSRVTVPEIRLIRNNYGYYFITANEFNHVYVFAPKKGQLKLIEKIKVTESGLDSPVFNWREPYVEVITENKVVHTYINEEGIVNKQSEVSR